MDDSSAISLFCLCGCGQPAGVYGRTNSRRGEVRGQPKRYVNGHNSRKNVRRYAVDESTGCWVWLLQLSRTGYAYCWSTKEQRNVVAHRVIYERYRGPIPAGLNLDHVCRNRACVNPDHLEPVTPTENIRRGASTKLTIEKAREIRALRATGMMTKQIAEQYNVCRTTVRDIVRGVIWKEGA
jgi:hypothetical protein